MCYHAILLHVSVFLRAIVKFCVAEIASDTPCNLNGRLIGIIIVTGEILNYVSWKLCSKGSREKFSLEFHRVTIILISCNSVIPALVNEI